MENEPLDEIAGGLFFVGMLCSILLVLLPDPPRRPTLAEALADTRKCPCHGTD